MTTAAELAGLVDAWQIEYEFRWTTAEHVDGPGIPQAHLVCTKDRRSVFRLSADTRRGVAVFTPATVTAAVMRHVREVHCDGGGNLI